MKEEDSPSFCRRFFHSFLFAIRKKNQIRKRTVFGCGSVLSLFFLLFSLAWFTPQSTDNRATASLEQATKTDTEKVRVSLFKRPLSFEANRGQTDPQVKFLSRASQSNVFFTPKKI